MRGNEEKYGEVPLDLLSGHLEGKEVDVSQVLSPVKDIPMVICIGLNYRSHAEEAKMNPVRVPIVFTKPSGAITGPYDDILVHQSAQSELDYEAELCVIIGKDAKNVSEERALDYVHGYTAGNDISARKFQLPEWSGSQFCFAKSYDSFAPIGPCVATSITMADPQDVDFWLKVNDTTRQKSSTSDMIFSVRQIIAHLSQGTTLKRGTVIMTGTPAGVGAFIQPKGQGCLKDRDTVDIHFEGIGTMSNKYVFE